MSVLTWVTLAESYQAEGAGSIIGKEPAEVRLRVLPGNFRQKSPTKACIEAFVDNELLI
jgi:hypothetical protein